MAMEAEFALAKKIKRALEQKHCRGLVVFANRAGQVTGTGNVMTGEAAIGLLTALICEVARQTNSPPQKILDRMSRMTEEHGAEILADIEVKESDSSFNK